MPSWTGAQLRAIQSESREIICSAAAGSGKTAVLVERIARFLKEGADPAEFLVMTFTNAAAAEMREKIRNRLSAERENPAVRNALDRMDEMQVSTIHSFCQQLIRSQFQIIGIDPNFQICDSSEKKKLFHEAYAEACNALNSEEDPDFRLLRSRFDSGRTEKMIEDLEPFILSLPEPFQWMRNSIESIPKTGTEDHPWFDAMRRMAGEYLYMAELCLSAMFRMFDEPFSLQGYRDSWKSDSEMFHVKQSETADPARQRVPLAFVTLKGGRGVNIQESDWKQRYQDLRKEFKKQMQLADGLLMTDPRQNLLEWQNMRESLHAVEKLLTRTEEILQERKRELGLADFNDLEQYAVQILSDPAGREEAVSTWRYVFVDECQDNSAVQNRIIDLLQDPENHLFMVGDMKQSIYRFRLADPLIFRERIRRCRTGDSRGRECISLQSNFRSRPEILETTNRVFRSVMKESVAEIEYGPEEELIPGRKTEGSDPVQVIRIEKAEDQTDLEAEAEFIRAETEHLLQLPYPGENRNYRYRDCVILMPAVRTDGPKLAELLEKKNIPVFFDGSGDYFRLREVQIIRNLLEWIDFPLQDLPLLSVLQGDPFRFTEEELSRIRLKHPEKETAFHEAFRLCSEEESELGEKCAAVLKKLRQWQEWAETMRVSDLIWELYRDTGFYYIVGAEPAGDVRQANLRTLAQQASQGESKGIVTLRQFLRYMKEQQDYGDQQSATLLGEQDNLIRIMTVHKSKGLQFPVVFCAGMDHSPTGKDPQGILAHSRLGLCVDYKDPEHRISRPTAAADIFAWQRKREEMAEKIRLLYVAMTRAQEKLYLITCRETDPVWSMPEGEGRTLSAKSFTDWWMPVLMQEQKLSTAYAQRANPYEIRVFESNQQKNVESGRNIHSLGNWLKSVISAPIVEELWKKEKENPEDRTLAKRSVTSLVRNARKQLEEDQEEETPEKKRMPDSLRRMPETELPEEPAFLREKGKTTAASRGTLTHRILSLMDLDKMRQGVPPEEVLREEKDRMALQHMASPAELSQISGSRIAAFWRSETGKRILRSPEVHREWNFNLMIRREKPMILQGVVDCAFLEENEWVILDYKTDRNKTAEEMREEYRPQLLWYARAIRELTGKPVREASLYSLALDCVIPVAEGPLSEP